MIDTTAMEGRAVAWHPTCQYYLRWNAGMCRDLAHELRGGATSATRARGTSHAAAEA